MLALSLSLSLADLALLPLPFRPPRQRRRQRTRRRASSAAARGSSSGTRSTPCACACRHRRPEEEEEEALSAEEEEEEEALSAEERGRTRERWTAFERFYERKAYVLERAAGRAAACAREKESAHAREKEGGERAGRGWEEGGKSGAGEGGKERGLRVAYSPRQLPSLVLSPSAAFSRPLPVSCLLSHFPRRPPCLAPLCLTCLALSLSFAVAGFLQVHGLFRGLLPPLLSVGVQNALLFAAYGATKRVLLVGTGDEGPAVLSLGGVYLAGAAAGVACSVVTAPTELVKCRLQVDAEYRRTRPGHIPLAGPLDCIRGILRTRGPLGLFQVGKNKGRRSTICAETLPDVLEPRNRATEPRWCATRRATASTFGSTRSDAVR